MLSEYELIIFIFIFTEDKSQTHSYVTWQDYITLGGGPGLPPSACLLSHPYCKWFCGGVSNYHISVIYVYSKNDKTIKTANKSQVLSVLTISSNFMQVMLHGISLWYLILIMHENHWMVSSPHLQNPDSVSGLEPNNLYLQQVPWFCCCWWSGTTVWVQCGERLLSSESETPVIKLHMFH